MSPMTAMVVTIRPPPPSPPIARKAISSVRVWLIPQSTEPIRKKTIAAWRTTLGPDWAASLPVDGPGDGRGEQVRGHDPGEVGDATEVADDRRQRRRDDGLIERGEQKHEQQRPEDEADALVLAELERGFSLRAHRHRSSQSGVAKRAALGRGPVPGTRTRPTGPGPANRLPVGGRPGPGPAGTSP